MRRNKTRRHLKGRRRSRRRQRGGDAAVSAKSWIDAVISKINLLPEQKITTFSDLKDVTDLTLTPPTGEERKIGNRAMDLTVIEGATGRSEDLRDMALRVRDVIRSIVNRQDLDSVTPQEFIDQINDPNRLADDTQQDSLKYLLTRENALLTLAERETLPMEAPVSTLAAAAKDSTLFIWALAINSNGEAVASLFDENELTKSLSESNVI